MDYKLDSKDLRAMVLGSGVHPLINTTPLGKDAVYLYRGEIRMWSLVALCRLSDKQLWDLYTENKKLYGDDPLKTTEVNSKLK